MSERILMRKTIGGSLTPIDELGREAISRVSAKEIVLAEIKRPRNIGHHRKFFALLSLIHENQTRYQTVEDLLAAIKVMLGHCETVFLKDGTEVRIPKSIAFYKMDQAEFDRFWDRVVKLVCEQILPGVKRADLERELLDLVA